MAMNEWNSYKVIQKKIPQRQNVAISQKCMNIFASNFVYMVKMRLTCFALCFVYSELLQTTHEAEARRFQHSINLKVLVPIILLAETHATLRYLFLSV